MQVDWCRVEVVNPRCTRGAAVAVFSSLFVRSSAAPFKPFGEADDDVVFDCTLARIEGCWDRAIEADDCNDSEANEADRDEGEEQEEGEEQHSF
jgi:hypothetical protein